MIDVPPAFAFRIEQAEGQAGKSWLAELPDRFAALIDRWGLIADGPPRHGGMSLVLPVRRGREPLALKVAWLNDVTINEALALEWWNGQGTVRLIESLPHEGALLLERLDPDRSLASLRPDEAATVTAELIRELAVPVGPPMPTFSAEIAGIISTIESRWLEQGRPFDRETLDRVVALALVLPVGKDHLMVNRDLWDDNVLASTRRPWVVIDPQPLAGPPEYALSPSLLRRNDQMAAPGDLDRFIDRACAAGRLDRDLVLTSAAVRIADYWLWAKSTGLTEDPKRCDRLLGWLMDHWGLARP